MVSEPFYFLRLRLDSTSISSPDSERTPIEVAESLFLSSSSNTKEDQR